MLLLREITTTSMINKCMLFTYLLYKEERFNYWLVKLAFN